MKLFLRQLFSNMVIQAIVFALFLWLMYELRAILIVLLFAFILMSGMRPFVKQLEKLRWPRVLAILTPYFVLLALIGLLSYEVLPVVAVQLQNLIENFPVYLAQATNFVSTTTLPLGELAGGLSDIAQPIFDSLLFLPGAVAIFIAGLATVIFLSIYLLWDPDYLDSKVRRRVPHNQPDILDKIESAMGMWVRGQVIIALIVGVVTWIGLVLLGVDFALTLAIITAILEFVPYIGPIVSALIVMIVAVSDSWLKVGLVAILFAIIQQVESNLLVPQVMKRSVNLHPITIIVSILIGTQFMGIIGALIAVPVATIISIIYNEVQGSTPKYRLPWKT